MVFATLLTLFGLGALLWLLLTLAVYALPAFAGLSIGLHAVEAGVGAPGAVLLGLIAGVATLAVGQVLVAVVSSPWLQAGIALLYAAPAAVAGYAALHGLAGIGFEAEAVRMAFGILGALLIGATAWIRMGDLYGRRPPATDPDAAKLVSHPSLWTRDPYGSPALPRPRRRSVR